MAAQIRDVGDTGDENPLLSEYGIQENGSGDQPSPADSSIIGNVVCIILWIVALLVIHGNAAIDPIAKLMLAGVVTLLLYMASKRMPGDLIFLNREVQSDN